MALARVLLSMCVLAVVCTVLVDGRVKRIDSSRPRKGNPTTTSTPKASGNDEILTKLEDFFNGKHAIDFTVFGQKVHIGVPKIPSSWGEVTTTVHRFIKRLRKDPLTRTIAVVSVNVIMLILIYTVLFVANIHLALKHRRAIAAASNGNSLLKRSRSVKINMSCTPHKDSTSSHASAKGSMRTAETPVTNLDVGLQRSQKNALKGKLSFNTTASEADIPRLADHSTADVFTSSGASTWCSTRLSLGSETTHERICAEVHNENVDNAHSVTVEELRGTLPQNSQLASADQHEAAVDSPRQSKKSDSP